MEKDSLIHFFNSRPASGAGRGQNLAAAQHENGKLKLEIDRLTAVVRGSCGYDELTTLVMDANALNVVVSGIYCHGDVDVVVLLSLLFMLLLL